MSISGCSLDLQQNFILDLGDVCPQPGVHYTPKDVIPIDT